jgi:hypothetical protein
MNESATNKQIITIDSNLEHLRYLGLKPGNCADAWKRHFKCAPWGKCQVCGFKIRMNRVIAKIVGNTFYGAKDWPPVFFIFGPSEYTLRVPFMSAEAHNYYIHGTNKEKSGLLIPVCYRCWSMALSNNYQVLGLPVNEDVLLLMVAKQNELTQEQMLIKLELETEYVREFVGLVNQGI